MAKRNKTGLEITCRKCKNEWVYRGDRRYSKNNPVYISCPKCRANLKLKETTEEMKEGNDGMESSILQTT